MSPLGRGSSFCVRREPATGWKVVPWGFQVSKGSINTHAVDRIEFRHLPPSSPRQKIPGVRPARGEDPGRAASSPEKHSFPPPHLSGPAIFHSSSGYGGVGGTWRGEALPRFLPTCGEPDVCAFGQGLLICSSGSGPHNPWALGLHRGCRGSPSPTLWSSLPMGKPYNLCFPPFLPTMCPPCFTHAVLLPTHPLLWEGREGVCKLFSRFQKSPKEIIHLPQ